MARIESSRDMGAWLLLVVAALAACGGTSSSGDEATTTATTSTSTTGPGMTGMTGTTGTTGTTDTPGMPTTGGPPPETTDPATTSDQPTSSTSNTTSADSSSGGVDCSQIDLQSDPDHCGACGHPCFGGACEAGVCQPVSYPFFYVVDMENVYTHANDIAADADNLYFEATTGIFGTDSLFAIPRGGGDIRRLGFIGWEPPTWIFPRGDKVYAYTPECCATDNVLTYDKPSDTATGSGSESGKDAFEAVFLGEKHMFFSGDGVLYATNFTNDAERATFAVPAFVYGVPVTGNSEYFIVATRADPDDSAPRVLRKIAQSKVHLGEDHEMPTFFGPGPRMHAIVADETFVYASTDEGLLKIDIDTGDATTLVPGDVVRRHLQLHDGALYWLADPDVDIWSLPTAGGAPTSLIHDEGTISGLWADDLGLVWTVTTPAAVWQLAR